MYCKVETWQVKSKLFSVDDVVVFHAMSPKSFGQRVKNTCSGQLVPQELTEHPEKSSFSPLEI